MPIYRLDARLVFPPPARAPRRGPMAVGGDLRPERLLLAYSMGIFPWQGDPLHWHSPDPRMVLYAGELHVSRSLAKTVRQRRFRVTLDVAFREVMTSCATVGRTGQDGTWITPAMIEAYSELHRRGFAHSVEVWSEDVLVGGLYGISLGAAFFGESMFSRQPNASKVAFVLLVEQLRRWSIPLVDCQVYTSHLESLGAREWPRAVFLAALKRALRHPTRTGPWRFDEAAGAAGGVSGGGPRRSTAEPPPPGNRGARGSR